MAKAATQTTSSFKSILDRPATSVERPKPLPAGTYVCLVKGEPKFDEASTGTQYVEFSLCPQSATEDVDEDALKEALSKKDGTKIPLNTKSIRARFYLTEDSLFRLTKFLGHLGFDIEDKTIDISRMVHESPGCQVLAHLKHTPSKTDDSIYAELDSTAAVE